MKTLQNRFPFKVSSEILHLIFPNLCLACERELAASEAHLCSFCQSELSPTRYHLAQDATPLDQSFWGRTKVEHVYAHYFFEKHKTIQNVLFSMKYAHNKAIGVYYGQEIGRTLKDSPFASADAIIPVPLHPKKEFMRGYNQSQHLSIGIAEELKLPIDKRCVRRLAHTSSQTRKSRFQRWENVDGIFAVHPRVASYRHVIIVDDVITTGSTIEAMIDALRSQHPDLLVSVVTLACA